MKEHDGPLGSAKMVEGADDLGEVAALLSSRAPVAIDTEGTGLDPFAPDFRVRMVQFGTVDHAFAVPSELAGDLIRRLDRPVYMHNRTYDVLVLEVEYGRPYHELAPLAIDTGVLSRVLDPRQAFEGGTGHKLEELGKALLGVDDKGEARRALQKAGRKLGIKTANMWRDIPIDTPEYWQYAGQDTILTVRIAVELTRMVQDRGLAEVVAHEHRIAYDLGHMRRSGIMLDKEWTESAKAEYERELSEAEENLVEKWDVVPNGEYAHRARPQLVERFKNAGVQKWPSFTPTGREQLNQSVLAKFLAHSKADVRALAQEVERAQEARHFAGYTADFLSRVGRDGRVHPSIKPLAAKTGRMSISEPPLQQLPRDDYRLRGCFIPDPGHVLIGCDYSQIEVRIAAAVCNEDTLTAAIHADEDVYMRVADIMGGAEHRQIAKTALLGKLYGAGPNTLQEQTGVSQSIAYQVVDAINTAYPKLEKFSKRLSNYVENNPEWWPRSMNGRPLPMDSQRPYASLNRIIQPEAREVMANAVLRWSDAGYAEAGRLVVHDEGIFSVPEEDADQAVADITRLMSSEYRGIPLSAESQVIGSRWAKT